MVPDHLSCHTLLEPGILSLGQHHQEPRRSEVQHLLGPDSGSSSDNRMAPRPRNAQPAPVDRYRHLNGRRRAFAIHDKEESLRHIARKKEFDMNSFFRAPPGGYSMFCNSLIIKHGH